MRFNPKISILALGWIRRKK